MGIDSGLCSHALGWDVEVSKSVCGCFYLGGGDLCLLCGLEPGEGGIVKVFYSETQEGKLFKSINQSS